MQSVFTDQNGFAYTLRSNVEPQRIARGLLKPCYPKRVYPEPLAIRCSEKLKGLTV